MSLISISFMHFLRTTCRSKERERRTKRRTGESVPRGGFGSLGRYQRQHRMKKKRMQKRE